MTLKPESKQIIAVDIDDVLTPHFEVLINWYNQTYGTSLTLRHNHPTDPRPWGTSDYNVAIKQVQKFFETPNFLNSKPYQESVEALKQLHKTYDLVVLTGRDTIIQEVTTSWLDKHYGKLFTDIHFTARYSLNGREKDKSAILEEISAEYFIDDALHNCLSAVMIGVKALLFGDYPWNAAKILPAGVTRVKDWRAALAYFEVK